jgi:urease accessory protein
MIMSEPPCSLPDRAAVRTRPGGDLPARPILPTRIDPRLLIWLSPSFPVGSFAYSHGLEYAAERGWVHDRATLETWLGDLAQHGSLRSDLILATEAWRAAASYDGARLWHINATALALQPSAERHLETVTQGTSFLAAIEAAWPADGLDALGLAIGRESAYPVAVGMVGAVHGIDDGAVLDAYAIAFTGALISAAIRLSVIGQTDGQRTLAGLMPVLAAATVAAADATLDDLGTATLRSDLASAAHETQYTRLFRS